MHGDLVFSMNVCGFFQVIGVKIQISHFIVTVYLLVEVFYLSIMAGKEFLRARSQVIRSLETHTRHKEELV